MNRGIVMELGKKHMIVLAPDGRFRRVPRSGRIVRIGEEIELPALSRRRSLSAASLRPVLAAAAILAIIVFSAFGIFGGGQPAIAYVTIDINPSVELGVDNNRNVVEARGLNADGESLLSGYNFKGKALTDVTGDLIAKAQSLKYIPADEADIVISSTVVSSKAKISDAELADSVKERVDEAIRAQQDQAPKKIVVAALPVPQELREEANKKGISPGKMALRLIAQQQNNSRSKQAAGQTLSAPTLGDDTQEKADQREEKLNPEMVDDLLKLQRQPENNPEKLKQMLKKWVQENKERLDNSRTEKNPQDDAAHDSDKSRGDKPDKDDKSNHDDKSDNGNKSKNDDKSDKNDKQDTSGNQVNNGKQQKWQQQYDGRQEQNKDEDESERRPESSADRGKSGKNNNGSKASDNENSSKKERINSDKDDEDSPGRGGEKSRDDNDRRYRGGDRDHLDEDNSDNNARFREFR